MPVRKKKVKLRLEALLKEKGITKYRFAQLLGKTTSNVAVYFRPGYSPRLDTLIEWAEALDCKVRDFLDE